MPMGCASSCKTFKTFSTLVKWIAREKLSIQNSLHLLDDFLIVPPSASLCHKQLYIFLRLCGYLGIPIAPEKICGPSTIFSFVGIELDTVQSQARLSQDKLINCTQLKKAPHHRIRLADQAKEDLKVWLSFLSSFNGRSFFLDEIWHSSDRLNLFTDAAGLLGLAAVFENHWCYGNWPSD